MRLAQPFVCIALFTLASCAGTHHDGSAKAEKSEKAEKAEAESAESEEEEAEGDVGALVAQAKVSLLDALHAALAARPGEALVAELEESSEDGKGAAVYEIAIVDVLGAAWTVTVDPATGKVLESQKEDEADEMKEMTEQSEALPAGHLKLGGLLERGAKAADGFPVTVKFRGKKHAGEAKVELVSGGKRIEVRLDAVTGKVLGVEK